MTALTRLRSLLAAATPGPWTQDGRDVRVIYTHFDHRMAAASTEENAAIIAAAVNALPNLIRVAEAAKRCQPTKIGHMAHCQANARLDCTCGKYESDAELSKALAALEGGTHE